MVKVLSFRFEGYLFSEYVQNLILISKMQKKKKKNEKWLFSSEIIADEFIALHCLY